MQKTDENRSEYFFSNFQKSFRRAKNDPIKQKQKCLKTKGEITTKRVTGRVQERRERKILKGKSKTCRAFEKLKRMRSGRKSGSVWEPTIDNLKVIKTQCIGTHCYYFGKWDLSTRDK